MRRKPRILIIDSPRGRSPLLTQYYNYLHRKGGPLITSLREDVDRPIDKIVKSENECPDYVYVGFTPTTAIKQNPKYLENNHIKIIAELGDASGWGIMNGQFFKTKVDMIVYRSLDINDIGKHAMYYKERKVVPTSNGMMTNPLSDAKIVCMPWAINPAEYYPKKWEGRDVDVAFICSVNTMFKYHDKRREIKDELQQFRKWSKLKIEINNKLWGDDYKDLLCRTKIFVVDSSMRDFFTQKYLEGPVNGCMLMGEIPTPARDYFQDKVNIVEVEKPHDLIKNIRHYLAHPKKMQRIAERGTITVKDNFTMADQAWKVEEAILEDFRK